MESDDEKNIWDVSCPFSESDRSSDREGMSNSGESFGDESLVPDPWNLTILGQEDLVDRGRSTPVTAPGRCGESDSPFRSLTIADQSSPRSDETNSGREQCRVMSGNRSEAGQSVRPSGSQEEAVNDEQNDSAHLGLQDENDNAQRQQEQQQPAVSQTDGKEKLSEQFLEKESVEILSQFDPLWERNVNQGEESPGHELNELTEVSGHSLQIMAMTSEDLNMFVSVLPNINPLPINLEAKSIIEELERFEWDFNFRYNALLPEDLRRRLPAEQKAAAWMMAMGAPAREALRGAEWATGESKHDIDLIKKKLIEAVSTPATKYYAVHSFWDARQEQGETAKQFIHRLEMLAAQAGWEKAVKEENMMMRLARALLSKSLRTWIMGQPVTTSLAEVKKHCIAMEVLDREDQKLQAMSDHREHAAFSNKEEQQPAKPKRQDNDGGRRAGQVLCRFCGQEHYPGKNPVTKKYNCPASGHLCRICNKRNHYESVCWGRKDEQQQSNAAPESTKVKKKRKIGANETPLIIIEKGDEHLACHFQRQAKADEDKAKKKRRKEKTRAVSESSDSSTDSEQENRIARKVAKKLEKALAVKAKPRSSTDSTPSTEETHFTAQLSESSDDGGVAPQAKRAFHQAYGRRDGGGSSGAGLRGGAAFKKPEGEPKAATLLKDFRIPKVGAVKPVQKTAIERKADVKHKSAARAVAIRQAVSLRAKLRKIASGECDLLSTKMNQPKVISKQTVVKELSEKINLASESSSEAKTSWSKNVSIDGKAIKMKVDSGSTITILTLRDFFRLGLSEARLQPTKSKIVTYSGNRIIPLGKLQAKNRRASG